MSNIKKAKKITAFVLSAAMALSMTACGEDTVYCGTSDGKDIPSGLYIYYLLNAYYDASSRMTETDTDVFAITIDEKDSRTWITDTAMEELKEYLAVEAKFDEYGLALSDEEISAAKITVENLWSYYGTIYEGYGISENSFRLAYINDLKSDKLFEFIYGEGGEQAVSDEELRSYMAENYALVNFISMNLVDGEQNLLKSEGKAERMEMAKDYVERAKNGEDFDTLNREYQDYFEQLCADAALAAAQAESEASTEEEGMPEMSIVDVDPADAGEEAPAETEAEVTSEETAAPGETEAVSETVSDTLSEAQPETEANTETEAETASEETSAPEETEAVTDTEALPDDTQVWADEPTSDDVIGELAESADDFQSNKQVIKKDTAVPDEAVNAKVFEMNPGDVTIVEENEYYYVVARYDLFETESYYLNAKDSLLHEMSDDDFDSKKKQWASETQFTVNEKAVERYVPDRFAEEK